MRSIPHVLAIQIHMYNNYEDTNILQCTVIFIYSSTSILIYEHTYTRKQYDNTVISSMQIAIHILVLIPVMVLIAAIVYIDVSTCTSTYTHTYKYVNICTRIMRNT